MYIIPSLFCIIILSVVSGLRKKRNDIHHECQDELLKLMALNIQRKIAGVLQCTEFFTIMVDECTDVSNKEQVINNNS